MAEGWENVMLLLDMEDADRSLVIDSTDFPKWPAVALLQWFHKSGAIRTSYTHCEDTSCRGEKKSSLEPRLENWGSMT